MQIRYKVSVCRKRNLSYCG